MPVTRRRMLAAATLLPLPALAQGRAEWPSRPIRIVVPYPPGGGTDILARAVAETLRPHLPQPIVVENRPGANGVVGSEQVARAEPDGHLLLVVTSTHTLNRYAMATVPYHPVTDFTPVSLMTRQTLVLVSGTVQPFATFPEMLAQARANPGRLTYGATEALTSFAGQELNRRAGIQIEEVMYRGGGLVMNDIVAGHLPLGWTSTASAMPHLATGRVRTLAVSPATRTPLMPDVPTVAEAGVPGYDVSSWVAMLAPPRMPRALAERIHAAVAGAYAEPALQERFRTLGLEPDLRGPEPFAAFLAADDARWAQAAAAGAVRKFE
ncbi:Bug family tripartite tricarboxylate transporter substrate binding protein [Falsiroseomonas sp. CW058]|uniref:Bug family tripartite tricarboxylate transporter substrate binding protein n=1 Tax=Falsiroseomonas sp. CW058 TaxID=3388664 RepID=UPI003D310FE5